MRNYFKCHGCSEIVHNDYGKYFEIKEYEDLEFCEECSHSVINGEMLIPVCEYSTKDKDGNEKCFSDWTEFKKTICDDNLGYTLDGYWFDSIEDLKSSMHDLESCCWTMGKEYIQELIEHREVELEKLRRLL